MVIGYCCFCVSSTKPNIMNPWMLRRNHPFALNFLKSPWITFLWPTVNSRGAHSRGVRPLLSLIAVSAPALNSSSRMRMSPEITARWRAASPALFLRSSNRSWVVASSSNILIAVKQDRPPLRIIGSFDEMIIGPLPHS